MQPPASRYLEPTYTCTNSRGKQQNRQLNSWTYLLTLNPPPCSRHGYEDPPYVPNVDHYRRKTCVVSMDIYYYYPSGIHPLFWQYMSQLWSTRRDNRATNSNYIDTDKTTCNHFLPLDTYLYLYQQQRQNKKTGNSIELNSWTYLPWTHHHAPGMDEDPPYVPNMDH